MTEEQILRYAQDDKKEQYRSFATLRMTRGKQILRYAQDDKKEQYRSFATLRMTRGKQILRYAQDDKEKKGFTMIEMVVSIAIVVMLTIMFVTNYHSTNQRTDLIMTAQNLVAELHLAQNNTLGLVKYNGTVPAGGWGLSFNKASSSYTLFADLDSPGDYGYLEYDPSTEGNINYGARTMTLPSGITISDLQTTQSAASRVNVIFLPPDPQTIIYDDSSGATSTSLTIELQESTDNSLKTIRVNFLGLAEVIN